MLTLAQAIRDFDVTVVAPRMPGGAREEIVDNVRVRRVAYFPRRWEGLADDAIVPTLRSDRWRVIEAPFLIASLVIVTWREVRRQRAVAVNSHWILPAGSIALAVHTLTACRTWLPCTVPTPTRSVADWRAGSSVSSYVERRPCCR